jgi:iron complex transport system substrate-binding protein
MKLFSRYLIYLFVFGILIFSLLSSCGQNVERQGTDAQSATQDCRVVQHVMGETCIPKNPERIVTLWPTIFANTLALNIEPIATDYYGNSFDEYLRDYLPDNGKKVEIVGGISSPSLEKILQLKPDLILANTRHEGIYTQLSGIAPAVMLDFPTPPGPWKEHFMELARVLDKENKGEELLEQYWQRIEKLQQALGDRRHELQVSVANGSPEYVVWTYDANHPVGMVLNDIGLQRPPAQRGSSFYRNLSQEQLSMIDGDVLFFLTKNQDQERQEFLEEIRQNPLWQKLEVVQRNRVYFVDAGHWHGLDILAMNAVIDDLFEYLVDNPTFDDD